MKDNKKYNKALVDFMKGKAKQVAHIKIPYFTAEDELDLMQWLSLTAKSVWKTLVENIIQFEGGGMYGCTCPYCIEATTISDTPFPSFPQLRCQHPCCNCLYGKRHGQCDHKDSTYKKLLFSIVRDHYFTAKIFPNAFYVNLIKELKKKYKI